MAGELDHATCLWRGKPEVFLGYSKGVVAVGNPLLAIPLGEEYSPVRPVEPHLIERIGTAQAGQLLRVPNTMNVDGEKTVALDDAARDLVTHPASLPSVLAGEYARDRRVFQALPQEAFQIIIALLLTRLENAAVEEAAAFLLPGDNPGVAHIPSTPAVGLIVEREEGATSHLRSPGLFLY